MARFRKGDIVAYSPHGKDRSTYQILQRKYSTYILSRILSQEDYILIKAKG